MVHSTALSVSNLNCHFQASLEKQFIAFLSLAFFFLLFVQTVVTKTDLIVIVYDFHIFK